MEFKRWEPIYLEVMKDMGYDPMEDVRSARLLDSLCPIERICNDDCISKILSKNVTVVGDSPHLEEDLDMGIHGKVLAADGATHHLVETGILPDIIVTDLDGDPKEELRCNAEGSLLAVHAHGDNMDVIERFVPYIEGMITPTVQCRPFGYLKNFGGFTDGDRAVLMAIHFGADSIRLLGFDFLNPREKQGRNREIKLKKLAWARRIILDNSLGVDLRIVHEGNWQLFTDTQI